MKRFLTLEYDQQVVSDAIGQVGDAGTALGSRLVFALISAPRFTSDDALQRYGITVRRSDTDPRQVQS